MEGRNGVGVESVGGWGFKGVCVCVRREGGKCKYVSESVYANVDSWR